MHPSHLELLGQAQDGHRRPAQDSPRSVSQLRSESSRQRSDDSWVEISSQPSSSSLSSIADEVVTTGLRVQHESGSRRRRRGPPGSLIEASLVPRPASAGSSQEEYDESESDVDPVMTSSNEELAPPQTMRNQGSNRPFAEPLLDETTFDGDDADEEGTALGVREEEMVFTPQPNAFSHPPQSQSDRPRHEIPGSYFPAPRPASRSPLQRHSYPGQRRRQHAPFNVISPSYQAENDAALRASLSTLLSCAAAARGLPKHNQPSATAVGASGRVEPATLRMVPESDLMGEEDSVKQVQESPKPARRTSGASSRSTSAAASVTADKGKRRSSSGKERRVAKKVRRSPDENISPTLLTWIVSAGVVVLVSAISFSAGYAMGKEAGKAEMGVLGTSEGSSCGQEAMKGGLRKLRWGAASASVRA
ncbi:hypothetical protein L228DRAFT_267697 [Xylona heveae TC161]|uniref:REJ domain-containing protein n=1 Tax=Xylona heveae (strain CBS 132557 / TC161) TaxID=1328760 RepID=A0A161TD26_XYLHT|nr:hypothetical protein L228DRAFT_267697 [Xylona heveae TC161]KZF23727.1 hypothetical protein L228DRAFT_267697 [Xylona heveae TC161]